MEPEFLLELNGASDNHKDEFKSRAEVMLKDWLFKQDK
jgi:hypothetical protein